MRTLTVVLDTPWAETLEAAPSLRGITLETLAAGILHRFAEAESRRQRGEAATAAAADEAAPAEGLLLAEEQPPGYEGGSDDPGGYRHPPRRHGDTEN